MNVVKTLIASIIVGVVFLFLDMIIGISTAPILAVYANLPIWRNPPNIVAGMIFDLVNGLLLVLVYLLINEGLPLDGWKKGVVYGAIIGLFRVVMGAFSTIVMYNVPLNVVIIHLITGYVEIVVLGIVAALICEKYVKK